MSYSIRTWLDGDRSYQEGVELYCKYGKSKYLKQFFKNNDDDFCRQKLASELQAIVVSPAPAIVRRQGIIDEPLDNVPEKLKALVIEVKRLYKENGHHLARILEVVSDQERGELANTILDNEVALDDLLLKIDFYKQHKRLPDDIELPDDDLSDTELKQQLLNLRSRISKLKKKPEHKLRLEKMITEKEVLERRLHVI